MSSILPRRDVEQLTFFETHTGDWAAHSAAMGTTVGAVAALVSLTAAARAAYQAQKLAQAQARAATQAFQAALALMKKAGTDIIQQAKARAASAGEQVYGVALLPAPKAPAPLPPPGMPMNFVAALHPDGALQLKWDCPNPRGAQGTIYQIARRSGDTGPFVAIGISGIKRFTDATLPAGAARVTYQITPLRSTALGTAAQFIVNFGSAAASADFIHQVGRAA